MKVLCVTLLKRTANGQSFYFPRAMDSIYSQCFQGDVDFIAPASTDTDDAAKSVATKYERARAWTLSNAYDALFTVESDMIIPPDALAKLAGLGVDVAYGLYVWRHGHHNWNAYTDLKVDKGFPLSDQPEQARKLWGQTVEVAGIGLGCTLIRRYVLEAVPFRWRTHMHCDWLFAMDAATAGAQQVCDTSVVCGHIAGSQVFYPDISTEGLYRAEVL